jgi:pimeloyl-ACP methyl ester carboxylesterase
MTRRRSESPRIISPARRACGTNCPRKSATGSGTTAGSGSWSPLRLSTFPVVDRDEVKKIKVPVLLLCGEKTLRIHQLINDEMARLLPQARRVTFTGAAHDMWSEQPEACQKEVLEFLKGK